MRKLHLGCGKRDFGDGWFHIDGADFKHIHSKDVTKLPFKNDSVDLIYASHLISYFDRDEIVSIFNEWKRVLKQRGILRIATPDFRTMSELYVAGDYPLSSFLGPIFGKMQMRDSVIYHKTTYDYESLRALLMEVGFRGVQLYNWKDTEHAHIDDHSQAYLPHMDKQNGILISLNIEATK